ncbi:serine hydrolase [Alkalihalobacillus sp. TS-13]|uniref:serine hydrolase domain-containing protein n=1 Tax=Alkalihalobacillus sp. TS-13 TaxID=2842455 RepID=UPI001C887B47|nr:serine hydrolase domain-containing protein [Alkalihalobacillus sp. TS-13]
MLRILVVLLVLFVPSIAIAEEEKSQKELLETFMEEAMEVYKIPGASLGLVQNGEVTFKQSFGEQGNGEPVTNQTLFTIGSVSKPLTSLGILKLAEKGDIKLDEPIDTYISFDYGQSDSRFEITIRQLLSHTSGIGTFEGLQVADQNLRGKEAIAEAVAELEPVELTAQPGEIHQYSAANYLLLGKIIEEVSGIPFAEYMQKEVFASLGMDRTYATYSEAEKSGYQPGHQSWFGKPIKSDLWFDDSGAPYGYMASTMNDMTTFITRLVDRESLLSEPYLTMYFSPEVHRKEDYYYGLGWRMNTNDDDPFIFHGGETPDTRAELFISQSKDYAFVLLTNKNNFSEVMQTIHMKEGIRSIIEKQEVKPLPETSYKMQWLTLSVTAFITLLSLWNLIRLARKKVIHQRLWFALAAFSILLAILLIPLLVTIFEAPWHTFVAYGPETVLFIKIMIGVFIINGLGLFVILGWNKLKGDSRSPEQLTNVI